MVGDPLRMFHMYSNVCASTMIENKVKDFLRKVRYKRVGGGSVYFEPLHIEYIPIRNNIVETGELVNFEKREGILTLHFKKEA